MEVNFSRLLEGGQKRMMLYIAGGIAGVLMMLVILCNLLLIVSNVKEPDQMPEVFGIRPAIVLSGSMEPTFYPGDVILLKKTKEPEALEVGDVACYLYSGKATTHRITERFEADGKTRYIMKGDYNNAEDRLAVDTEQIQGVWTGGRIPHLGRLLMFLQSTMGMFLFLICPLAGVLSWDILKRRREEALRREAWENGESAAGGESENGSVLGRELRRISGFGRKREDERSGRPENDEQYRRLEAELEEYRRREEGRRALGETEEWGRPGEEEYRGRPGTAEGRRSPGEAEYHGRPGEAEGRRSQGGAEYRGRPGEAEGRRAQGGAEYRGISGAAGYRGRSEEARLRRNLRSGIPGGRRYERDSDGLDEEFAYYAGQEEDLDYLEELEEAARYYRKMKESLARYRRMEAVMERCRRLEEELARYEALVDRLETYEQRQREYGRQEHSRPASAQLGKHTEDFRRGGPCEEHAGMAGVKQGVSNQRTVTESSVDHIDRQSRSEKPE